MKIWKPLLAASLAALPFIWFDSEEPKIVAPVIEEYELPEFEVTIHDWTKQYNRFAGFREKRYGVAVNEKDFPIFIKENDRKSIPTDILVGTIKETLRRLPHIRTTPELVSLLKETAIVESTKGYDLIGYKNGKESGDYGVFQLRLATVTDSLNWLRKNHKDVYSEIQELWVKDKSLKWNIIHNVPYSCALSVTYYWRRDPHRLVHGVADNKSRGMFWKEEYNTKYGAGTVAMYVKKTEAKKQKPDIVFLNIGF